MRSRAALVALEGPSGVGKSTLGARLARILDAVPLAEAVDRIEPSPDLGFRTEPELLRLERSLLTEDARRFVTAQRWTDKGRVVVADTGFLGTLSYTAGLVSLHLALPRTLRQLVVDARALTGRGRLGLPDLTIYLSAPPRSIAHRLRLSGSRHPQELRARHRRVGRFEHDVFRPWLGRVAPRRVLEFRAVGPPGPGANRLALLVARASPLRERSRPLGHALDRLLADLAPALPSSAR